MIVAIASGKGGTGKTTLAVNLARVADRPVLLLDCDVEEPNAHLFLGGEVRDRRPVGILVPEVDEARCDACGECGRVCAYHAIVAFGTIPLVFPELCHGCGGCAHACPRGAIREVPRRIGEVETRVAGSVTLVTGRLDVGAPSAPPVIRAVRTARADGGLVIIDAPPGTACAMVAAVRDADVAVLVTEPTPFGLHDLELAATAVRELGVPFGVVINRAGDDDRVRRWCAREGVPVLLEIPDDRRVAEACARGALMVDAVPEYRPLLDGLFSRLAALAPAAAAARTEAAP